MSLRKDYDIWHERIFEEAREHDDASSPWYQLVREHLGPIAGLRILELACGRGGFVKELALAGAPVTGCDFSMSALRVGQNKLHAAGKNVTANFIQGDAQALPFANDSFDMLVSCETIEHVPDPVAALREMYRVTRPGGRLFLTTPNYANFMGLYDLYAHFRHPGRKNDQPFDRRQWFPQIRKYVRHGGWKILRSDGTVHQFPFFPGRNPVEVPVLESNRVIRRLLSPLAYHYFLVSEKRVAA